MSRRIRTLSWYVPLLAAVLAAGCTKAGRSIVNLDITADNMVALDRVEIRAMQRDAVAQRDVEIRRVVLDWVPDPVTHKVQVGLYLSASVQGLVQLSALGISTTSSMQFVAHSSPPASDPNAQVMVSAGQVTRVVNLLLVAGPPTSPPDGGDTDAGADGGDALGLGGADGGGTSTGGRLGSDGGAAAGGSGNGGTAGGGTGGGPGGGTGGTGGGSGAAAGKAWSLAELVENDRTDRDRFPHVAMTPTGNAVVAWQRGDAIWARGYNGALRAWGTERNVAPAAYTGNFDVGMDDAGNTMVVWVDSAAVATQGIWWSRSTDGGNSWSAIKRITPASRASALSLAVGPNGTALVAWEENPGNNLFTVMSSDFRGVDWNPTLNSPQAGLDAGSRNPRVAVDGQGRGLLVWASPAVSLDFDSVWVQRYDVTWSRPSVMAVESYTAGAADSPCVVLNESGAGTVTWLQYGSSGGLWARRFDGTAWLAPEAIIMGGSIEYSPVPEVAMDPNADAVAIWSQALPTNFNARASRHVTGAAVPWDPPRSLETDNAVVAAAGDYANPIVRMDRDGNAVALWRKKTATGRYLAFTGRLGPGSTAWAPLNGMALHDDGTHSVDGVALAVSRNGTAIAAWNYGTEYDIWASVYR